MRDVLVLRQLLVRVAVKPALTELCRRDDGMLGSVRVLARVTVRGAIAAQRAAAFLTRAQMHPPITGLNAFLTHTALGVFHRGDRHKMSAGLSGHLHSSGMD